MRFAVALVGATSMFGKSMAKVNRLDNGFFFTQSNCEINISQNIPGDTLPVLSIGHDFIRMNDSNNQVIC
jgi:hypothetical protein